jgi:arsenate reductase
MRDVVAGLRSESSRISAVRRANLEMCATLLATGLRDAGTLSLLFLCTHNSRRSQMSQLWAQALGHEKGLKISAYSGGSQPTALSPAAARALQRAGFEVRELAVEGGVWEARYAAAAPPVRMFSKLWSDAANPRQHCIVLVNCSAADEGCPVTPGILRLALLYDDPSTADGTPEESTVYDRTCRDIGRELSYLVDEIDKRVRLHIPRAGSARRAS